MNVSAIVVTRGDHDLTHIWARLPADWEKICWNNGEQTLFWYDTNGDIEDAVPASDLSVYGRYAAIEYAHGAVVFTQDDDVIVSDPQAIVDEWVNLVDGGGLMVDGWIHGWNPSEGVVCNMPPEFRHDFYTDHALVGFGAAFHREAPQRAFGSFVGKHGYGWRDLPEFHRCCDVVFTALTPRVLVDVPRENLPYASDPGRMWTTPGHQQERERMLSLALAVRDA